MSGSTQPSYALVTPVRDEAENLQRLASSVLAQDFAPTAWVIVDNGSTDATLEVASELAERAPWVAVVSVAGESKAVPGAPIVRAFHAGLAALAGEPDVVVKLDADVSCESDYFRRLAAAFAAEERLAIASGLCHEWDGAEWLPVHTTGNSVRGASRAYRHSFLQSILPLPERMGWDGADELLAHARGWTTRTFAELPFRHHRAVGERDGARTRRWRAQGAGAHYMGYSAWYLGLRTLHHARRNPAALAMWLGYAGAALRRAPRLQDPAARAYLRRQQSFGRLLARFRETRGRTPVTP